MVEEGLSQDDFLSLRVARHDSLSQMVRIRDAVGAEKTSTPDLQRMKRLSSVLMRQARVLNEEFPQPATRENLAKFQKAAIRSQRIISRMERLLKAKGGGFSQRNKDSLELLFKISPGLLRQIERLDFVQRSAPSRQPLDMRELIEAIVSNPEFTDRHGRRVTVKTRLSASRPFADFDLVHSALYNLFTDASIHPYEKGPVHLRVSTAPTHDGFLRLRIVSAGAKPLSPDLAKKIGYESFSTREGQVHGVGKISVRRTAELHGGSFRALNYRGEPALEINLPLTPKSWMRYAR